MLVKSLIPVIRHIVGKSLTEGKTRPCGKKIKIFAKNNLQIELFALT